MDDSHSYSSAPPPLSPSPRIAFQGARGAFSEEAVVQLFGEGVTSVPRTTFDALFSSLDDGVADLILAPLENSLAGSVHRSYDLLLASSLHITAEVVIPIRHNLIGCPGATFDRIETVASHPVALAQCERFFAAHPRIERIASDDTAGSVAQMMEAGDPRRAAIASARAARTYGACILREGLEDHAENYTRFVLLAPEPQRDGRADKLSLAVKLQHQPGALSRALSPFAVRGIDLLKIESRPVHGSPWQYHFYLDLQAAIAGAQTVAALDELRACADEVRVLGCYQSARALAGKHAVIINS